MIDLLPKVMMQLLLVIALVVMSIYGVVSLVAFVSSPSYSDMDRSALNGLVLKHTE